MENILNPDVKFLESADISSNIVLKFNNDKSIEDIIEFIKCLIEHDAKQEENDDPKFFKLDFRGMDTSSLIELYRFMLNQSCVVNPSIIMNLGFLTNVYNILSDDIFDSQDIWIVDVEQLLDIKIELTDEIQQFHNEVAKWYLACIKSMHKTEFVFTDDVVAIPPLYQKILWVSNAVSLSQIISKSRGVSVDELPLVENGYSIVMEMLSRLKLADTLIAQLKLSDEIQGS